MQALLDEIYAAPDEDGPRLVYADWLLERGDPRGTFIALQLERDAKHDPVSTDEQFLLDTHWTTWIGAPSDVLEPRHVAFERGLWSACWLDGVIELDTLDASAPTWGTVRQLSVDATSARRLPALLAGPLQRSLRTLSTRALDVLALVAHWPRPLGIEELELAVDDGSDPPALARGFPALPKLTTIAALAPSRLGPRWIERIDATGVAGARLVGHVDQVGSTLQAARASRLARVVIQSPHGVEITAARGSDGMLAVHAIAFGITKRFAQVIDDAAYWTAELRDHLAPAVTITVPILDGALVREAAQRGITLTAGTPSKTYAAMPRA
jgi:uncharacterized protein (TIGR02996 family)